MSSQSSIETATGLSWQQGQLADRGAGFQFCEGLRAVGQVVGGGASGGEDARGDEGGQLTHELAEDLGCGLDQHADVEADDVDLVLVHQLPV